jgi:hypothetical protein
MSVAEGSGTPKSRGAGSGNPKASKGGGKPAGSYGRGRPASGGAGQDRRRSGAGGAARQAGRSTAADGPGKPARKPAGRGTRTPATDGLGSGTTRDQGRRGPAARTSDGTRGTARATTGDGSRGTSRAPARSAARNSPRASASNRTPASGEYQSSRAASSRSAPRNSRAPASGEYRGRARTSDDGGFRPASRSAPSRSAPGEGSRGRTSPGGRPGRAAEGGFRRNAETGSDFRGAKRPDDTGSRRTSPGDARRSPRPAGERSSSRDGDRDGTYGDRDRTSRPARSWAGDSRPGDGRARDGRTSVRNQARPGEAPARGHTASYEPGPHVPDSVSAEQLDPQARAQLNSLPNDLADSVARYLVAADLDEDPERGYAYAQAAKRLAARVGVVREACGIAAYQTGRWAEALSELRAARRMTGRDDYLPIMADCERALGRVDRALALVREAKATELERATQIELRIVESGIRRDQGLPEAAVIALQVPELTRGRLRPWSARLFYAYADALLAAGRAEEARDWFARAAEADTDGRTDAADRLDELDGIDFEDLGDGQDSDDEQE